MKGIIYGAYNPRTDKWYIGQTTKELYMRIRAHLLKAKKPSNNPFYKDLKDNKDFEWVELDKAEDKSLLDRLERLHISRFEAMTPNGYNIQEGGLTTNKGIDY